MLPGVLLTPANMLAAAGGADATQQTIHGAILAVALMLLAAKLGGALASRLGQPAVLGELVAGILLGNLGLFGFHALDFLRANIGVQVLAEVGILLVLFAAGLESTVGEMARVGASSLLVAVLGVVAPMLLGWGVSAWLLPDESWLVHLFVGATLCATSVGITARVLADLGQSGRRESKIILGAAAIDDVLGLLVLAIVGGTITAVAAGSTLALGDIAILVGKAFGFLGGAVLVGPWLSGRLFRLASLLGARGLLLPFALVFCFALAWLAARLGLAPIVGAYAAGLVLEDVHYRDLEQRDEHELDEVLHPIIGVLSPIFFVLMGLGVDLRAFVQLEILGLAAALTFVAVLGKMACWFGVLERGLDRLAVAVGMVPRGEVGLIFAAIGARLVLDGEPVIGPGLYGAIVIMVTLTTLMTPPLLQRVMARGRRGLPTDRPSR